MKSKQKMTVFFVIVFIHYISANLAHPITPTLIVNLQLPSYMFGAAFAAMAFTSFLFSPFWGKMREFFQAKTLLFIGSAGYALGQYLFGIATNEVYILLARCLSGFFVGAINVSILIYLTEMSEADKIGSNLAKLTIFQSLGSAAGFLIGGSIGIYSIFYTFLFQAVLIFVCGIFFYLFLESNPVADLETLDAKSFAKEINPIQSFLSARSFMTVNFAILFLVVALAHISSVAFDQSFNYYIKAHLQLTSIYNGFFKAAFGIITLITNSTICIWIFRHKDVKKSTALIFGLCGITIAVLLGITPIVWFLVVCMIYFSFHSISVPLIQDCIAVEANINNRNQVMGFYNAIRSLGMILGALLSGFLYDMGTMLPFVLAGICLFLAAGFMINVIIREKAA